MLETLSKDEFAKLEQQTFTVLSVEPPVEIRLVEVKAMGSSEREGGSFSLLWQGPSAPFLPQSTYRLHQETLGDGHLFLVPINEKSDGFQYESVFT